MPNRQKSNRDVRRERKAHEQSYTRPKPPARVRPVTVPPESTPPKPEQPAPKPEQPAPKPTSKPEKQD